MGGRGKEGWGRKRREPHYKVEGKGGEERRIIIWVSFPARN